MAGSTVQSLVETHCPERSDLIAQAKLFQAREEWIQHADNWLNERGHYNRIPRLVSDDDAERFALEDSESLEPEPSPRTFNEIYKLDDLAAAALSRPERFAGEHYCARTILEKDVPKWRSIARAVASGLETK